MAAFHAPPVAEIMPVTTYGKTLGSMNVVNHFIPLRRKARLASLSFPVIIDVRVMALNSTYHFVSSMIIGSVQQSKLWTNLTIII
ncbi:hypothetical protein [Pantoea ananatis]|jgi:hypothetical protein|uniref:hypothetical protein n=1 Tax=Pantoea ananas TaxID=553 RepID=UPI0015770DEC|nr:hypothetical protein [Pantoea ananatis]MDN4129672.1 hypothetical protein [Pantoea ananatis]MDN4154179.1 hypothetical protein [Pantoea ananatis]